MPMNLGEERTELIANTIASIVNQCSKNSNVDGMLMNCYAENNVSDGIKKYIPVIKLSIVCITSLNIKDMLNIEKQVKELGNKTNIKVLTDFRDSIEFGLLGLYNLSCGESNPCNSLIDGEILYDRTKKYADLKNRAKNLANIKSITPITIVPSLNISNKLKQRVYS